MPVSVNPERPGTRYWGKGREQINSQQVPIPSLKHFSSEGQYVFRFSLGSPTSFRLRSPRDPAYCARHSSPTTPVRTSLGATKRCTGTSGPDVPFPWTRYEGSTSGSLSPRRGFVVLRPSYPVLAPPTTLPPHVVTRRTHDPTAVAPWGRVWWKADPDSRSRTAA